MLTLYHHFPRGLSPVRCLAIRSIGPVQRPQPRILGTRFRAAQISAWSIGPFLALPIVSTVEQDLLRIAFVKWLIAGSDAHGGNLHQLSAGRCQGRFRGGVWTIFEGVFPPRQVPSR